MAKDLIPFFSMKRRNLDNVAEFVKMPAKNKVLLEHLQSLEFPMIDEEIMEFKFTLISRELCEKLDSKSVNATAKLCTATNTGKFR